MQPGGIKKSKVYLSQQLRLGWWLLVPAQILLLILIGLPTTYAGWQLQVLHLLTTVLCALGLSTDRTAFSLNQVYWVFTFVFLALMPSIFFSLNFLPHGLVSVAIQKKASLIIWLTSLLYTLVSFLLHRNWPKHSITDIEVGQVQLSTHYSLWIPILMGFCVLMVVLVIGPGNLWLQTDYWRSLESSLPNTLLQLLFQYGLRGLMLYCCLMGIYAYRQGAMRGQILLVVLLLALIANFPLAMSRYLAGTFYLAMLLWWLPATRLKPPRFALLLVAIILLAAPILNVTRMQYFPVEADKQRDFSFLMRTSYRGDYDAYAMLCRTIQYTDSLGSTSGQQLAGAFLFFVPRNLWVAKPVGSGSMVYKVLVPREDHWDNVSCPFVAEGYVNFGTAGSMLFTLLLATGINIYDRKFWQWRIRKSSPLSFTILFYPVAIGLLLLWLRGDMLSAFAYSAGLLVSGWVAHSFFFKRI